MISLHAGQTVDPVFGTRAAPIFSLERAGHAYSRIDAGALAAAGITQDMIRLSPGLEDVADIQADFEDGFRAAIKVAQA
jgi:O-acetylhomoserine/O-acetylserine sulfhydrylase-like pyridoxal-dependent enzyme